MWFKKGTIVKLSRELLDRAYSCNGYKGYRRRAAAKRFIVIGYTRDGEGTRVRKIGGSSSSSLSYRTDFLVKTRIPKQAMDGGPAKYIP